MFDEKYHDRTDSFGTRMERLGEQMTPSPQLMRAAASGAPLPNGIRYSAGTHVKRFSKAILLYVACVAILIGAIMLLPRWFSEQSPVATEPPATTTADTTTAPINRDAIQNPQNYTEKQLAELRAAWAVIKPYSGMYTTINDYEIWDFFQLRDMIICQYTLKQSRPSGGSKVITLGGYEFYYSVYFSEVYVFANENRYTLKAAYDKGVLSQEDLGIVWKDHKDRHPTWYEAFYSTKLPLQDNRLQQMLYGKTSVNDLIDQSSLDLDYRFSPDDPENTGVGQLFDGIKSEEAYNSNGTGVLSGDCDNNFCFLFDMQEKVQISAYVITTGNDIHLHTDENPVAWWLYATNDAEAAAQMREEGADEGVLISNGKWVDLDYVWDGKITAESFHSYGYMVDADKQGEYQYYCWLIEYVSGERVQVAELELYVD